MTGPGLFDDDAPSPIATAGPDAPLAERMRPRTLDEVVGQHAVLAPGARRCARLSRATSCSP